MKKLLLSVIAFALITTSCNKYKDDFKNLNARLDALAAQIQGVSTLVAGIQASQLTLAQLTAATAGIAPLQASVTALTTTVNNINTVLATVAAGTASNTAALATLTTLVTNNQIAALAAIGAVTTTLNTALNTQTATLNASITAAQNALALAITAAQTNINNTTAAAITAAQTALNNAITAAITNINGNTNSQVAAAVLALQNAVTAAQTNINANTNTAVTNAQAALAALIGAAHADIILMASQLTSATSLLNTAITAAQTAILANANSNHAILKAIVDALTVNLAIANAQIQTLLSSNNVFIGDLIINDEATLTAAEALGAKVRVITGNVNINTTGLSSVDPDGAGPLVSQMVRLKRVTNGVTLGGTPPPDRIFIGTVSGNVTLVGTALKPVDVGSLVNVSGVDGDVTVSGGPHILSGLISVKRHYSVSGSDVSDDALQSVGGNLSLSYPAAYSYPALTTVTGNIVATDNASVSSVLFPVLSSVGMINGDAPVWGSAGTINLAVGNLASLTAASATTITLGEPTYPGAFTLTGPFVTSLTMSAASSVAGALTITIGASVGGVNPVTTVNLSNLTATTGTVTISTDASTNSTVNLAAYNDNDNVVINGPTVQTLPAYTGASAPSLISSGSIVTLTLPVYRATQSVGTQFDGLTAMQGLTIGDVRANITTASFAGDAAAALRNLTATSSVYAVNVTLTSMANLISVSTAGLMQRLALTTSPALTTVTTSGLMDYLDLTSNGVLTSVTIGHNYVASGLGQGTNIIVFNNDALTTFSTGTITGRLKSLSITENNILSTLTFPSFVTGDNITAGVVSMSIFNNKLSGSYTPSIFATNTAPVIVQAGLLSIKAYALNVLASVAHAGSFIDFGFFNGAPGGGGPFDNSIATLDADATAYSVASGDANPGPNSFVQRLGDAGGALGSRINVARELGYVQ